MNKIETITPEQEKRMPEYVRKWINRGINTDRLDPANTRRIIDNFRKMIDRKVDVPLYIVKNPIEAWVVCCLSVQGVANENLLSEMEEVFNGNPKKRTIPTASLPWQTGSLFSSTFSFYDYMFDCLGVKIDEELYKKYKMWEETSEIGCIYPMPEFTVVCEKPTEVYLNENNVLHRDGGPALVYDGHGDIKIYALNGVVVPEHIAVTPAEDLDLEEYNKITNADVRAEFVRKVGIEMFLDKGKLVDTYKKYDKKSHDWWHKSEYEMYDMAFMFSNLEYAPFLKMVNQTTGIFHLEGVSPNCRNIKDALKERFHGRDFTIQEIK